MASFETMLCCDALMQLLEKECKHSLGQDCMLKSHHPRYRPSGGGTPHPPECTAPAAPWHCVWKQMMNAGRNRSPALAVSAVHTCGIGAPAPAALCSSCAQHHERT